MTGTAHPTDSVNVETQDAGVLDFGGMPWAPENWWIPAEGTTAGHTEHQGATRRDGAGGHWASSGTGVLSGLRAQLVEAHASALRAQHALQRRVLRGLTAPTPPSLPTSDLPERDQESEGSSLDLEAAFKPLARSTRSMLSAGDLALLARGEIATVLGAAYDQRGANPHLRLGGGAELLLTAVDRIDIRGGRHGRGLVIARCRWRRCGSPSAEDLLEAAVQTAELLGLYLGVHLCFADASFEVGRPDGSGGGDTVLIAAPGHNDAEFEMEFEVSELDLLPRPWLVGDARCHVRGRPVGRVDRIAVTLRERPGTPVGPDHGGVVPAFLGRISPSGAPAMLGEFHLAHLARGDQGIALGPEFAGYLGRRATRLPSGGLLLVDRVIAVQGTRGELEGGASHDTEYDAAADSWYYRDTANASMPNCVLMETSLQSALLVGYFLGATLRDPEGDYSLRNLEGSATLLRDIELRDATIAQHSTLRSTLDMPGSVLQDFEYTLSEGGQPFYSGESMFGYFMAQTLANQVGLDGGRCAPSWLESQDPPPPTRTVDIAARRRRGGSPRCSTGHLALLDTMDVVDGGGRAGLGYLHVTREVDPQAWFFARHFHLDPVIPGSLGVETLLQALQEWLVDAGHGDELQDAEFVVPVGATLKWKYRGQILPTDAYTTIEVHVIAVEHRPGRVRVVGAGSLWKSGLRIYEISGATVELREPGAPLW